MWYEWLMVKKLCKKLHLFWYSSAFKLAQCVIRGVFRRKPFRTPPPWALRWGPGGSNYLAMLLQNNLIKTHLKYIKRHKKITEMHLELWKYHHVSFFTTAPAPHPTFSRGGGQTNPVSAPVCMILISFNFLLLQNLHRPVFFPTPLPASWTYRDVRHYGFAIPFYLEYIIAFNKYIHLI